MRRMLLSPVRLGGGSFRCGEPQDYVHEVFPSQLPEYVEISVEKDGAVRLQRGAETKPLKIPAHRKG